MLNLPSQGLMLQTHDYSFFYSTMDKDQTTTPGTTYPTLYDTSMGSFTSPANQGGAVKKVDSTIHRINHYPADKSLSTG